MTTKQWIELPVVMTFFDFDETENGFSLGINEGDVQTFIENTQIQISHIVSFHSHEESQTLIQLSTLEEILIDVPKHILEDSLNIRKRGTPRKGKPNE